MPRAKKTVRTDATTGRFTVGLEQSLNISRVEGLELSKDMRATFDGFAKKGMSHAARREALVGKYGKKGS